MSEQVNIRSLGEALPMVARIAGGPYTVGDANVEEAEALNPRRTIVLSAYWMGVHPVTNAQYVAFVNDTGVVEPSSWEDSRFNHPDQPVVCVSWDDALAYCEWAGGSLPTEAQWEVCARGADRRVYPWGEDAPSAARAHFAQDWNRGGTCQTSQHPSGVGPFGHHDLAGNVWEWCLDTWSTDETTMVANDGPDPIVRGESPIRPLRGGCWRSIDSKLQAAYRNWFHRVARHVTIGFRLCIRELR